MPSIAFLGSVLPTSTALMAAPIRSWICGYCGMRGRYSPSPCSNEVVDHRQERVLGEQFRIGHLALAQIAAGAAQVELLVDRRARHPFDAHPGGLLLLRVDVGVDAERPAADAVFLRLPLRPRASARSPPCRRSSTLSDCHSRRRRSTRSASGRPAPGGSSPRGRPSHSRRRREARPCRTASCRRRRS